MDRNDNFHFEIQLSNINLVQYKISEQFMQSAIRNKDNECYCRFINSQPNHCHYDGILDLANCYHAAPVILTYPHFSGFITRSIAQSVSGLTPNDQNCQTCVNVEPVNWKLNFI